MNEDVYWEIVQFDGTITPIPPDAVAVIRRRWNDKEPIHTSAGSIPANQIKAFRPTSKRYSEQPLLEAVSQAFKEPIVNEDGSMAVRWVKKSVTQSEYGKHYAGIPAYRKLGGDGSFVSVAFRVPVHEIDLQNVEYCTNDDINKLTPTK